MKNVKVNQPVNLPDNRTGIVVEVDQQNRTAKCAIDPRDVKAAGATATAWFHFDDLTPLVAFSSRREDEIQAARRVADEATGQRQKTRPSGVAQESKSDGRTPKAEA
jgi:hypothetical protein